MIFNTIEFLDSANKPLPVPDGVRLSRLTPMSGRRASIALPWATHRAFGGAAFRRS